MVYRSICLVLALAGFALADTGFKDTIQFRENDGSPVCMAGQVVVNAGQLTCAGNKATLNITGGGGGGGAGVIGGIGNLYDSLYISVDSSNTFAASGNIKIFPSSVTIRGAVPILSTSTLQSGATFYVSSGSINGNFYIGTDVAYDGSTFTLQVGTNTTGTTLMSGSGMGFWAKESSNPQPFRVANPFNTDYYPLSSFIGVGSGLSFPNTRNFKMQHQQTGGIVFSNSYDTSSNGSYVFTGLESGANYFHMDASSQGAKGPFYVSNLAVGECVQTTTGGELTTTGAACGSGSGGGDNLGDHVSTKTITANYGIVGTTVVFSAYNASASSMSVLGFAGALVTYGVTAGSVTVNDLTASRPTLTDSNKKIVSGQIDLANSNHITGTLPVGNLPADGYASTYVNVTGDTMTGQLTNQSSVTVTGAGGLTLTYGVSAASVTASNVTTSSTTIIAGTTFYHNKGLVHFRTDPFVDRTNLLESTDQSQGNTWNTEIVSDTTQAAVRPNIFTTRLNHTTDPGSNNFNGLQVDLGIANTGTPFPSTILRGLGFNVNHYGGGAVSQALGVGGAFQNKSTGTVSNAWAMRAIIIQDGGGTITMARGLAILAPTNSSGTLTTTQGVYIGNMTAGTQTNTPYGIYQEGTADLNYLAGLTYAKTGMTIPTKTAAQIAAITPSTFNSLAPGTGEMYYCSNCTTTAICISTGTAIGAFGTAASRTAACN